MISPVRQDLLGVLTELSAACPDMRFGQLIASLSTQAKSRSAKGLCEVDDDELLAVAREQLKYFNSAC